jgi:predicted flap endonuclease-1-like 5' DNA nuclease
MFEQNIALGPGTEAFSSHLIEVVIMLLGAAILGFIIGWLFKKSYKEEFFAMKTDHDKCPGIKAGLENNISLLESSLSDCKADLGESRNLVSELTTEKDGLQANLNARVSDLATANSRIAQLEGEIKIAGEKAKALQASLEGEKVKLGEDIKHLRDELYKAGLKISATAPVLFVPDMKLAAEILGKQFNADDLKIVEGIGPKIEELFHAAGIKSWSQISETPAEKLKSILEAGGEQFKLHDPSTWPQQAKLAAQGLWKELKALQEKLLGGKV